MNEKTQKAGTPHPNGSIDEHENRAAQDPAEGDPRRLSEAAEGSESEGTEDISQAQIQSELEKAKKDYLYLLAEFENHKKHVIKERSEMRKYGCERLIVELLGVLDIFETALKTEPTPENLASFVKGMEMTANSFRSTLHRFGVEEIAADGQPFDPNLHEAISSEATDRVAEGHISQVFKKPFRLHERVIRPGQVVVATKPKS